MTWLDGFQKVTYAHTPGLAYTRPVRGIVFHTTEGGTEFGAFGVYSRIQAAPHFTVNPETRTRYQHIDTDLGAYALRNLAGGVETNTSGVVQIELVGFAKDTEFWSTERLRWIGEEVVAPIMRAHPTIPNAVYLGNSRMTFTQWNEWSGGLCGHKDVPENDHTDPGGLNLQTILSFARGVLSPSGVFPEVPEEATDMIRLKVTDDPAGAVLVLGVGTVAWIATPVANKVLDRAQVKTVDVTVAEVGELLRTYQGVGLAPNWGALAGAW